MDSTQKKKFGINLEAMPVALAGLANYQEGAVVSSEIYSKAPGTITIFAFDRDQGLSSHTAPFDAIVYVLEGRVKITIAEKDFELAAGDLILMPAHVPHALKALTRFKMLLTLMRA